MTPIPIQGAEGKYLADQQGRIFAASYRRTGERREMRRGVAARIHQDAELAVREREAHTQQGGSMNARQEVMAPEVAPVVQANTATLLQVIQRAASDPAVDIDKMERLMAMHERMVAREAETAWNDAMAACQREVRQIHADAFNPQTRSNYATYSALDYALRPIYSRHGFAISYNTEPSPLGADYLQVIALVSKGAHTRSYAIDMPRDGKGAKGGDVMTKTHATGAGMQYGMRYLLKGIFNVAIGDLDNDGNAPRSGPEPDTEGKAKLEACASLTGLQEAWKALTAAQRKTLAAVKDECKTRIEAADKEAAK